MCLIKILFIRHSFSKKKKIKDLFNIKLNIRKFIGLDSFKSVDLRDIIEPTLKVLTYIKHLLEV